MRFSLNRATPWRLKKAELVEVSRFILVAGFNTIATYLLYVGLLRFCDYRVAYSTSYATGIVLSYLLNTRFVFRRRLAWSSAIRFPLVYVVQYVVGLILLTLLVQRAHVPPAIAAIIVVAASVPLTFVLSRLVIRRAPGL